MKIIGIVSRRVYLAEINHEEIEKVLSKFYGGGLGDYSVGKEIDLAAGHNFRADISSTCEAMKTAMEKFDKSKESLFKFALLVGDADALHKEIKQ